MRNFNRTLLITEAFPDPFSDADGESGEDVSQGSRAWMQIRAGRISGGRIGSLAGKNKYCKALTEVASMVFRKKIAPNFHMRRGTRLEPLIAAKFLADLGPGYRLYEYAVLLVPSLPHFSYSPDGVGVVLETGIRFLLEIKGPVRFYPEGVPLSYMCQMQLGMWLFRQSKYARTPDDFSFCYFVQGVETDGEGSALELRVEKVAYDPEFAETITQEALRVWKDEFVPYSVLAARDLVDENLRVKDGQVAVAFTDVQATCPFFLKKPR